MKIVNFLLSIIVFFVSFVLLYQVIYFDFIDSNKINNYIDNIRLTDKVNFGTSEKNYFIDNVNSVYKDFNSMKYSYSDIKKIEKESNINYVISSILKNSINYLKSGGQIVSVYSKKDLDEKLVDSHFDSKIKDYIISNDYKLIQFENRLNTRVNEINHIVNPFRFIFDKIGVIISLSILFVLSIYFATIKKYKYLLAPLLITNFFNVGSSIISLVLLNTKYKYTLVNYFFYDFIFDMLKKSVIISVIVIFLVIIIYVVISIISKKNKVKVKPRIRKEIKNEEDFSFGL